MGVVMQAAEFADLAGAEAWEAELLALRDAYIEFEETDPEPWSMTKVPPPLLTFAARRGVVWPLLESSRLLLRGSFRDAAQILRVDRLVFLWGDGFELGGATLAEVAKQAGASRTASACHLRVPCGEPAARAAQLGAFLDDEDHAGRYTIEPGASALPKYTLFSITFGDAERATRMIFDGSGMQDWAFVTALPQLDGEDPRLEG